MPGKLPTILEPDQPDPAGFNFFLNVEYGIELCALAFTPACKIHSKVLEPMLRRPNDLTNMRCPAMWISFHQLVIDFQKQTGLTGPSSSGGRWSDSSLETDDHRKQVKWFAQYLTNLCKAVSLEPYITQRRPPGLFACFLVRPRQIVPLRGEATQYRGSPATTSGGVACETGPSRLHLDGSGVRIGVSFHQFSPGTST